MTSTSSDNKQPLRTSSDGANKPQSGPAPRDAATIVIVRQSDEGPKILMGQRGSGASFMPSKFVFPGGALDQGDITLAAQLGAQIATAPECGNRLNQDGEKGIGTALALAAIRETFEETGLLLGTKTYGDRFPAHPDWQPYSDAGLFPDLTQLRFIFRAITPHYRPKRFDARFFLANSDQIVGDPDDFTNASGELSHLKWLTIKQARALELPLITEVVLAEVDAIHKFGYGRERAVPFFHHAKDWSRFDAL